MSITPRAARAASILCLVLLPLSLIAQGPQNRSRNDEVLSQEGYVTPPREIAEAVLAPRYLNLSLSNLSRDKKWFLQEIGDGPQQRRDSDRFGCRWLPAFDPIATRRTRLERHVVTGQLGDWLLRPRRRRDALVDS